MLGLCADLFYFYEGWVKVMEEGYSYALFITRRQILQREIFFSLPWLPE